MAQDEALISWSVDISGPDFLMFGWIQDDYSTTLIIRSNDTHRYSSIAILRVRRRTTQFLIALQT